MSFYITLPSNASMDVYKNNVKSSFTTNLLVPLKLEGNWEVGLIKMIYRNSIISHIGFIDFHNKWDNSFHSITLEVKENENLLNVFLNLENSMKEAHFLLSGALEGKKYFDLTIDKEKAMVSLHVSDPLEFKFRGTIANMLNISPNALFDSNKQFNITLRDLKIISNEAFFIYTDIIEEQIVGDTKAPLLDTVSLKGLIDEAITIDIPNPNYVNVIKSDIASIHISIKDSEGENIHFTNLAKVIVKLHFRPKKYEVL